MALIIFPAQETKSKNMNWLELSMNVKNQNHE